MQIPSQPETALANVEGWLSRDGLTQMEAMRQNDEDWNRNIECYIKYDLGAYFAPKWL